MIGRGLAICGSAAAMLAVGASGAHAQALSFNPATVNQGTALVIAAEEPLLAQDSRPADSIAFSLPRGTRFDSTSREELCRIGRSTCPESSRIGSGRYVVAVRKFLLGTGEAKLAWSLDAFLGKPLVRGDAASVILQANLLGAGSVAALLAPALGSQIPTATTTVGRLIARRSAIELRFAELPVAIAVPEAITATPNALEVALSAVRRRRDNFIRRIRIRTPSGFEVRKFKDHRLIGHHLLRTPTSCRTGSWRSELRVGFSGDVRRTRIDMPCTAPE